MFFFAAAAPALALDPSETLFQYNCRTWRRDNGLPANSVNAIAQTRDGRLWLGTSAGLIYFDGTDFQVASPAAGDEAADMAVTTLARRGSGGLWYGLGDGGLGIFDGGEFHPAGITNLTQPLSSVHQIQEGAGGAYFLAAESAAGRLRGTNTFDSLLPAAGADVFSICQDARGRVWMGTADRGLFYWENGKLFPFPDPTLRGTIVSSIAVEPSGKLWIGVAEATNGLRCYDAGFHRQRIDEAIPEANVLLLDKHGVLWIGTFGQGLARYENGTFTFFREQDGLANDRVLSLAETDDGNLWIGTADGLTELSDVKFPLLSATEGMAAEGCLSVAPSPDGGIWAGTPNGVSFYHNGTFSNFGAAGAGRFQSTWIKRVFAAGNGDIYFIDALKELDRFSDNHITATWTNGIWPRAMAEDAKGIVVAFGDGLMRIENDQLVPFRLANGGGVSLNWINDLLVARDGSLWVASDAGVCQITNGILRDWTQQNGMPNLKSYYLCEDDSGAVWAAQDGGIARFKNGAMGRITHAEGLYDGAVCAMVEDKFGSFWMDSSHGIFRVSLSDLNAVADGTVKSVACKVYNGLDSVKTTDKIEQEYSGCRSLDGRIWFPSSEGIIMVDPAHVPGNRNPPPIFLDLVRINGRQYSTDSNPRLDAGPGNLEFDYSAPDYTASQKVQYRYMLEGYDADWVNAGARRSAFYTNIKPGNYRFEVRACNSDGVWDTAGAAFALLLPRPFDETLQFRLGCATAVVGFIVYFWWAWDLRRRKLQLQRANVQMEARVRERTAELAASNAALVSEIEQRKSAQKRTEELQEQLMNTSRQAGQAEVATNVLHNVGNVLNSVNVSAGLVGDRLRQLRVNNLAKAAEVMERALASLANQDKQLITLPDYLKQLGNYFGQERDDLLKELSGLTDHIEHIKEVVAFQQNYAKVSGVLEQVAVSDLVDSVLKMQALTYQRHGIVVVRDYQPVPQMFLDKHKFLQILINLIDNARHACDAGPRAEKKVIARINLRGSDHYQVAVEDNGVGIAASDLTRIFSHGFTTRMGGHGFGLHSSALAARQMGGSLTAMSNGPGLGATFILELPLTPSPPAVPLP